MADPKPKPEDVAKIEFRPPDSGWLDPTRGIPQGDLLLQRGAEEP